MGTYTLLKISTEYIIKIVTFSIRGSHIKHRYIHDWHLIKACGSPTLPLKIGTYMQEMSNLNLNRANVEV